MRLEIKHFKAQLMDYSYLISKLARIHEAQVELETQRGVHAVRFDKEHGGTDPLLRELQKLDGIERAVFLEEQEQKFRKRLDYIMKFIDTSPIGPSVFRIYCTGESTYQKEADRLYIHQMALKKKVNREIAKYLNS